MSIESREIYPKAPLRLVAFELRYPLAMKLGSSETLAQFQEHLAEDLPNVELGVETGVSFTLQQGFQELAPRPLFKLFSRDRRTAITLMNTSLVIETAAYVRYVDFRHLIEEALTALKDSVRLAGMIRLGLRYVNELRVPGVLGARDWEGYVDDHLLGPIEVCREMPVNEFQTRLQSDFGAGRGVQMTAGTLHGEFVSSQGPLRVEKRNGPFFLIDIDSYIQFDELQDFAIPQAVELCDALREPVRQLFEGSITEKLRDEVLRVADSDQNGIRGVS